jgi:hypothetical protein
MTALSSKPPFCPPAGSPWNGSRPVFFALRAEVKMYRLGKLCESSQMAED